MYVYYVCIINVLFLPEVPQRVIRLTLRQKVLVSARSHSNTDISALRCSGGLELRDLSRVSFFVGAL